MSAPNSREHVTSEALDAVLARGGFEISGGKMAGVSGVMIMSSALIASAAETRWTGFSASTSRAARLLRISMVTVADVTPPMIAKVPIMAPVINAAEYG